MPPNKRHHFVPQFYLRNFGVEDSIALYNLSRKRHVRTASIRGECQRSYLYGKDPSIEAALAQMEGMACNAIRRMITTELVPADTSDDFFSLIAFVAFQHGRTPKAGEVINEMATKLSRAFLKMPGVVPQEHQPDIAKLRAEWPNAALQSLGMAASVSHVLLDLRPYLLANHSPTDFVASDSPVVFFNPWCRGARGKGVTGFASSGLQIYLPLSPRHQLLLVDDGVYGIRNINGCVRVDRHRDVKGLNALQLLFVENSLYYHHTTATQAAIDDLPFHWRHDRLAAVHVQRAVADGQRSQLVGFHEEQPDVRLDLSFVRIHRDKVRVPLPDRMRALRGRAVDADRFFRGERPRSAASSTLQTFRVVESD